MESVMGWYKVESAVHGTSKQYENAAQVSWCQI